MTEVAFDISELGFSDPADLKAALEAGRQAQAEARERDIADTCKAWQTDGKTPALVTAAEQIMMADEGTAVLNLSEGKTETALTATDIVKRLVEASESVKLDQDLVTDEKTSDDKPEDKDKTQLSQEVRALASQIYLSSEVTEDEAVEQAKSELAAKSSTTA